MKYILGIQPNLHHFHTDSDRKMTNLSVNEIKLKQYVLIAKAGLAVIESKEKGMNSIEDYLLVQFTEAVKAYSLPPNFLGFDKNAFLRTKNFNVPLEKLEAPDLHTGSSLWRKYKEIRLVITHELGALLAKKLPGGQPPSGKSMSEILVSVRKDWFEACEKQREEKSRSMKGTFKKHAFVESWFPAEWEVFMTYGTASPRPEAAFDAKYDARGAIDFDTLHPLKKVFSTTIFFFLNIS